MKTLITASGQFGPFSHIETLSDRYRADGVDYQFSVIGAATIEDYVAPPPEPVVPVVPTSVSPRQIRQALTRTNLRTQVESAVASGDQDLKDWWEFATSFERSNIHVIEMGQALGVSPTQLDDLFVLAASL